MKLMKIFSALLILMLPYTNASASHGFCDPTYTREITPLDKTNCSANLYAIFPKIIEYKGHLFTEAGCSNATEAAFEYCRSGTTVPEGPGGPGPGTSQDVTISIIDLEASDFQTAMGKPIKQVYLMAFDPSMISPYTYLYQSNNKNFDKNMARIQMPSENQDLFRFYGLQNKRYRVQINIYGKGRFKSPQEVDAFVAEYTQAMTFAK